MPVAVNVPKMIGLSVIPPTIAPIDVNPILESSRDSFNRRNFLYFYL